MELNIVIAVGLVLAMSAIFFFSPILSKRLKFILLPIFLGIALIIILLPNSVVADIKVPFTDKSISSVIVDFLHTSQDFTNLVNYDPNVSEQVIDTSTSIVKACAACLVLGFSFFISAVVGYFIRLGQKSKRLLLTSIELLAIMAMSVVFIASPIATVVSINQSLDTAVARENENLRETYPEFAKYEFMFRLVELGDFMTENDDVGNILLSPVKAFSFADLDTLNNDLNKIDSLLGLFKETGLTTLYTDPDFDFSETTEETFNFDKLIAIVDETLDTKLLNNLARSFTNDILGHFEKILQEPSGTEELKENPSLKLSEQEFRDQYVQIFKLMEQVVKYDLVEHATHMDTDSVIELIEKMDPDGFIDLLIGIRDNPIVKKIDNYLGTDNELTAGIYTCIRMYDAMNSWLNEFRTTDFYRTAEIFLINKGVL